MCKTDFFSILFVLGNSSNNVHALLSRHSIHVTIANDQYCSNTESFCKRNNVECCQFSGQPSNFILTKSSWYLFQLFHMVICCTACNIVPFIKKIYNELQFGSSSITKVFFFGEERRQESCRNLIERRKQNKKQLQSRQRDKSSRFHRKIREA